MKSLREGTRAEHDAVEGAMDVMRADFTVAEYARLLRRLLAFHRAFERALPPQILELWNVGPARSELLALDLACLGEPALDDRSAEALSLEGVAESLGALYVVEGSALGGQIIARRLAAVLPFPARGAIAYFRGRGEQTVFVWKQFGDVARARLTEPPALSAALEAARATFRAFGAAVGDPSGGARQ